MTLNKAQSEIRAMLQLKENKNVLKKVTFFTFKLVDSFQRSPSEVDFGHSNIGKSAINLKINKRHFKGKERQTGRQN